MSRTKTEQPVRPDPGHDAHRPDNGRRPETGATPENPLGPELTATVHWDDAAMQSSYANVINVINTREEFSLFFGQNQTWDLAAGRGLTVKLTNRIVMSPYAVKRLHVLLADRLAAYEARFGALNLAD